MAGEQLWHSVKVEEAFSALDSTAEGISKEEALRRLEEYGPNELVEKDKESPWSLLLLQFKSFLIVILIIAGMLSFFLGEKIEAVVILFIVLLTGILGFLQEYRAEKAIKALKRIAAPKASLIRNGTEVHVDSRVVVVGDIVKLSTGDKIPADLRIIEAIELRVNEAVLTGESVAVHKKVDPLAEDLSISERSNIAYSGTIVTLGRGKGLVVATGMDTEFGKVAGMLQEVKAGKTPLEESLDVFGHRLGIITLVLVALVSGIGIIKGNPIFDMLIWGVALAVAAIPEALPAVVTVGLALSVRRMVKRNALVRRLPAVETLGTTTVICSDKTGTLTKGEMTVRQVFTVGRVHEVSGTGYDPQGEFLGLTEIPDLERLLLVGVLCNDSEVFMEDGHWKISGDPTEGALLVSAKKIGMDLGGLRQEHPRVGEIPFSSERKMMTTLHTNSEGALLSFTKGAVESIIGLCNYYIQGGKEHPLNPETTALIMEQADRMADDSLRVLAMAYGRPSEDKKDVYEKDLIFAGLQGMIDPPRGEAREGVRINSKAGIRTIMITGDNLKTASAIAKDLEILTDGDVMLGEELDALKEGELVHKVEDIQVYARVSPTHKIRVVEALQERGHIVAMTGDGVNDAPALKKANIGIAMGIAGTDVSRESSEMILTDDNFASIVSAVEEGRNTYKNIKNFITYGMSCHLGEVFLVFISLMLDMPLPLVAIQILWINLITDGLPPMALSLEKSEPGIMDRPPRKKDEGLLTSRVVFFGTFIGILVAIQGLLVFHWGLNESLIKAQTLVFTMVVVSEMFNAFNWRSENHSILSLGLLTNPYLIYSILSALILQIMVIYIPYLQGPFNTTPLTLIEWFCIFLLGSTTLIAMEGFKWFSKTQAIKISRDSNVA